MAQKPPQLTDVLLRTGMVAWSIVGMMVVFWAFLWVLGRFDILLAPVIISVILVYVLNPVVARLQERGLHRIVGTFLAFVVLTGGLILLGYLVVPSITEQASELTSDFPAIFDDTVVQLEDLAGSTGVTINIWRYEDVEEFFADPDNQDQFLAALWDRVGAVTSGLLEGILVFLVAPVIAFYALIDLPRVRRESIGLIPRAQRDEVVFVARQIGTAVGGFLRGQLLVALIVGILTSFGFWLIGLDFWLIIGMIAGFLNIVPFVGPWVGGALGVMVGLVTGSVTTALWAALVAVIVQQIDNNFVSPTVLRATVRLHPAVVILVLLVGGAIGGLWGVLLAVPLTAIVKIISGHLWRTRALGQTWEEASQHLIDERPGERYRDRVRREEQEAAAERSAEMAVVPPAEPEIAEPETAAPEAAVPADDSAGE